MMTMKMGTSIHLFSDGSSSSDIVYWKLHPPYNLLLIITTIIIIIFVGICFCCEICFVAIHAQLRGEKLSKTYSHGEKLPISVMVKPFGFMCVVSNICKSLKTFGNFWHWWHWCTDGINMIPKYFLDLSELYFEGKKPERSWDITIGWDDLGTRWDCNDVRLDG